MTDDAAMRELLGPIRERNRGKLVTRLTRVRHEIDSAEPRPPSDELRSDLHALIGALGTYGWPAGSELLATIQTAVQNGDSAAHLAPAVDELIAEIAPEPLP